MNTSPRSFRLNRRLAMLALIVSLSACAPAAVPPQLTSTPGPGVVVTDRSVTTSRFSLRYPDGWRVVTGAADAPVSVVLVAPDEISTITIQVGTLDQADFGDDQRTEIRALDFDNGLTITVIARAPAERWPQLATDFERIRASIQPV